MKAHRVIEDSRQDVRNLSPSNTDTTRLSDILPYPQSGRASAPLVVAVAFYRWYPVPARKAVLAAFASDRVAFVVLARGLVVMGGYNLRLLSALLHVTLAQDENRVVR